MLQFYLVMSNVLFWVFFALMFGLHLKVRQYISDTCKLFCLCLYVYSVKLYILNF